MLSTQHLLVGAAIVKVIPEPALALPLAFLSHFVLDSIPHWDGSPKMPMNAKVLSAIGLEYSFGAALVFLSTQGQADQLLLLFGAFLGTLPDFITGSYKFFTKYFSKWGLLKLPFIREPNEFHIRIQRNIPFTPGLVVSITTSLLAIFILLKVEF